MTSNVFLVMELLNRSRIHFFLQQLRPKSLTIYATFVGCRAEIEVFEDEHIEISRFNGDESIEGGIEILKRIIDDMK